MLGVQGGDYPAQGAWQVSFGWRYQMSDKSYIGTEYQANRIPEGTQVINTVNLADLIVSYQVTYRTELSLGMPYFMGTRSMPVRNAQGAAIDRYLQHGSGLGDVVFGARRWMFDPDTHPNANLLLGLGVKVPTGANSVVDNAKLFSATPAPNGTVTTVVRTIDQAIQPGDGGFGVVADFSAFKGLAGGQVLLYASGSYLVNPLGTSHVLTYFTSKGNSEMSVPDQYSVRGGAAVGVPGVKNLLFSAGLRWDGVPVRDLLGSSEGFRRPQVAISIEPGLSYAKGKNGFSLSVPIAVYRNRLVSVTDEANGTHGEATFADYYIMAGYTRRF